MVVGREGGVGNSLASRFGKEKKLEKNTRAIEVKNLSFRYKKRNFLSLKQVSFSFQNSLLISGASGSGKSTVVRILNGLIPHLFEGERRGNVNVLGMDPLGYPLSHLSKKIGTLLQDYESSFFCNTVEEEMYFSLKWRDKISDVDKVIQNVLDYFSIVHLRKRKIRNLSSGEKQKVALATLFLTQPKVFILDEPLSNLDKDSKKEILNYLKKLKEESILIMTSHRFLHLQSIFDSFLILKDGKSKFFRDERDIFKQKKFVEDCGVRISSLDFNEKKAEFNGLPPLLVGRKITFRNNGEKILDNIDIELYPGCITVLTGPNGSGKTTLAKILSGLLNPNSGSVYLKGRPFGKPTGKSVGFVFQNPLHQFFTSRVKDEIMWGIKNSGVKNHYVEELFEALDIVPLLDKNCFNLSWGEMERVAIASILALNPDVIILDELTQGQDTIHLLKIFNYLRKLKSEGCAILLITHDEDIIKTGANRVLKLEEGKIEEIG